MKLPKPAAEIPPIRDKTISKLSTHSAINRAPTGEASVKIQCNRKLFLLENVLFRSKG